MGTLLALMGGLRGILAAGAGALIGATLAYQIGHWRGFEAGRDAFAAEQAVNSLNAEKERSRDDAELQSLSDYDFCVQSLRDRGLPVDACGELRGVPGE